MFAYIIRRLLWAPVIIFIVSFLAFTITRVGPVDTVDVLAGPRATEETKERVREERGLNDPIVVQYGTYMKNLLTEGDFGESATIYRGVDVWDVIWPRILVSMQPGIVALVIAFTLGISVGIFAALRQGTWMDPFSIGGFLLLQSIPVLVSLPLLVLVFVVVDWNLYYCLPDSSVISCEKFATTGHFLPAIGWGGPAVDVGPQEISLGIFSKHIILPALVLSLPGVAGIARLVRATTLQVLGEDYVRTARAKGLPEIEVVGRHVTRNALLPIVTVIGLSLITLLEGAFFTELILGIPGIGRLGVQAAQSRDYDVILALVLILSTAFVLANLITDIVYTYIDPRIRLGEERN